MGYTLTLPSAGAALVYGGRPGTGAELAAAVVFLASQQASYITGQILTVDGGSTT